jgi:hypothetical protein
MAARNMHRALGNVRVGPLLQHHHANVGLCVSAVHSATAEKDDASHITSEPEIGDLALSLI